MTYQISRIPQPFTSYIPNGLHVGKHLLLRGRVSYGTEAFAINLQQNPEPCDGEVAFHFNPRPGEQQCVRNSFDGGSWMDEERDQPHFPFDEGRSFTLRIEVADEGFRTYVNGKPYVNFSHRLDLGNVHYLYLTEGAEFYDISYQDRYSLPYKSEIPQQMNVGKAVRIRGASQDNDGFSVNFACDPDNENCAFHFNPRPNEGVVVRNANLGGWGEEERDYDAEFPFNPNNYFDAMFICTDDKYMVHVNDKYFTEFNHRGGVNDASHFNIVGNLDIQDVEYFEPLEDDFVKTFPSGLVKGDVLIFRGFMKPGGETFSINFMNGYSVEDDIAFHLNPRVGEGQVVMNCCMAGDWGEEEREDIPSPLANREPFEVKVVVKRKKFKVYVNGKKCMKFAARGNVEDIKGVNIKGEAYVYEVKLERKLEDSWEYLPGGFRVGGWVVVQAIPKKGSEGFAINFRTGGDEGSDIAFHFNPRLQENCTIRNSCSGGEWGGEERDQPEFPFEKKDTCEIAIQAQPDKFVTYVNGQRYIDFNHRLPLESICCLELTGRADFFEPKFF